MSYQSSKVCLRAYFEFLPSYHHIFVVSQWEFIHPYVHRDHPELLGQVQRKVFFLLFPAHPQKAYLSFLLIPRKFIFFPCSSLCTTRVIAVIFVPYLN